MTTEAVDGVLGGTAAFVDAVRARLGQDDERVVGEFLSGWADEVAHGARGHWQGDLIRHLYGPERADAWLAGTPFA